MRILCCIFRVDLQVDKNGFVPFLELNNKIVWTCYVCQVFGWGNIFQTIRKEKEDKIIQ